MTKAEQLKDNAILEKLRKLSLDKKREILDFLEFLETREKATEWLEFDEWAVNLAKERGFVNLTEATLPRLSAILEAADSACCHRYECANLCHLLDGKT